MKKHWQCPECGGILIKESSTNDLIDNARGVIGNATCSLCGNGQDLSKVYGGVFDLSKSDDFIYKMITDTSNISFNQKEKRWYYKGEKITLLSDDKVKVSQTKSKEKHNFFKNLFKKKLLYEEYEIMTDKDKNSYKTIKIGNQVWMAENLKVSKYRNGDSIKKIKNFEQLKNKENNKGFWCNHDFDLNNDEVLGKLYNWNAVNDSRGLAPKGWHIPAYDDFDEFIKYLGAKAGKKIKADKKCVIKWNGNNISGYSGLPGGMMMYNMFHEIGSCGCWWAIDGEYKDCIMLLSHRNIEANLTHISKFTKTATLLAPEVVNEDNFLSIRCIKD